MNFSPVLIHLILQRGLTTIGIWRRGTVERWDELVGRKCWLVDIREKAGCLQYLPSQRILVSANSRLFHVHTPTVAQNPLAGKVGTGAFTNLVHGEACLCHDNKQVYNGDDHESLCRTVALNSAI